MEKIADIGEYLPYAKKHLVSPKETYIAEIRNETTAVKVSLKSLWSEPNWKELYEEGYPKDLLATIYGHYHALRSNPKTDTKFSQGGTKITIDMWEEAYIDSVFFIKEWCESAISLDSLQGLSKAFKAHFHINDESKMDYQLYAAGRSTGKSWFHALGSNGKYGHYKKLLPYLDWPNTVIVKNIKLFPIELVKKNDKTPFYHLCEVNLKSYSWASNAVEFSTYEDAVNALVEEYSETFTSTKVEETVLYTPRKKISNLIGAPDEFNDINTESLMNDFGFRGIQFGNALSNIERQAFISNTYHAFLVMASILDVPKKWIGFGGLGLAFGARGSGSAAAHYEPSLNIINLTRFNGAGSIAHEFFHSIDNRLAKKCGFEDKLYSELPYEAENEVIKNRISAFNRIVSACTSKTSSYYKCAAALGGQKGAKKYWTLPSELTARAFEAYIQDTVEEKVLKSQWLVVGTKESDHRQSMHPYPVGIERQNLNGIFKKELKILF